MDGLIKVQALDPLPRADNKLDESRWLNGFARAQTAWGPSAAHGAAVGISVVHGRENVKDGPRFVRFVFSPRAVRLRQWCGSSAPAGHHCRILSWPDLFGVPIVHSTSASQSPRLLRIHACTSPSTVVSRSAPPAFTRSGSSFARARRSRANASANRTRTGVGGSTTRRHDGVRPSGHCSNTNQAYRTPVRSGGSVDAGAAGRWRRPHPRIPREAPPGRARSGGHSSRSPSFYSTSSARRPACVKTGVSRGCSEPGSRVKQVRLTQMAMSCNTALHE